MRFVKSTTRSVAVLGLCIASLNAASGQTNDPPGGPLSQPSYPVTPGYQEINGGDKAQADRDASNFAIYRANHPEMSYSEAFYNFSWGGGDLP